MRRGIDRIHEEIVQEAPMARLKIVAV